jgi:uncharacterized protein
MKDVPLSDKELTDFLRGAKTIAVVGLSANPEKASHRVAAYLKSRGYRIIPVNPAVEEVLGEKSYPDLLSIPEPVDVVDVFRRPEHVPEIADEAIAAGTKFLWLQLGVTNEDAAAKARAAGLTVVQDACLKVEHSRLLGS